VFFVFFADAFGSDEAGEAGLGELMMLGNRRVGEISVLTNCLMGHSRG